MISEDRKKHIWGVAEFLKRYAQEENMSEDDVHSLYLLGLLHDIGYEFLEEKDFITHNVVGGGYSKVSRI